MYSWCKQLIHLIHEICWGNNSQKDKILVLLTLCLFILSLSPSGHHHTVSAPAAHYKPTTSHAEPQPLSADPTSGGSKLAPLNKLNKLAPLGKRGEQPVQSSYEPQRGRGSRPSGLQPLESRDVNHCKWIYSYVLVWFIFWVSLSWDWGRGLIRDASPRFQASSQVYLSMNFMPHKRYGFCVALPRS